jgi:membrane associated rhomboid family serine protease
LRALDRHPSDARAIITLIVLGTTLSLMAFNGADLDALVLHERTWHLRPWSVATATLLHGSAMHLGFNMMVLWQLGRVVEAIWGTWRTTVFLLFLAVGSNSAQWALGGGAIGLSGVVYGLFGLLWAASRWHPDKQGLLNPSVTRMLVGWFFLCILLTETGTLRIANVAHGSGALLGAALGWSLSGPRDRRGWRWLLFPALTLLFTLAGQFGRPYLNYSPSRAREVFAIGYTQEQAGDDQAALASFREATRILADFEEAWWNQGVCLQGLGRMDEAETAFQRARNLGYDSDQE